MRTYGVCDKFIEAINFVLQKVILTVCGITDTSRTK